MTRRGLVLSLVVVLGAAVLAIAVSAGGDRYLVRAEFADAAGLREGFLVKTGGVPVGTVDAVRLGRDDRAIAELRLDPSAAPIGRDARAAIRPSNLLGEKYVDLQAGDTRNAAPSGTLIPRTRTGAPTELDDVLAVLDVDTRVALGAFVSEQGKALVGRGGDLAATLVRMPPALDRSRHLIAELSHDNRALGRLIDESDRILATVARERRWLGRLVDDGAGALDALASRRRHLADTIRRAPAAIAQLRRSLGGLERAAVPLGPAARGLRRTAPALFATLRELPAFTAAARPTLRTVRTIAPRLQTLGRRSTPVVRRLRPVASQLRTFASALQPVTALLDQGIPDLLGVMQGWARATQNRDAAGHVFRADYVLGGDLADALRQYIAGPRQRPSRPPAHRPTTERTPQATRPRLDPSRPALREPRLPELPKLELPEADLPSITAPAEPPAAPLLDFLLGP